MADLGILGHSVIKKQKNHKKSICQNRYESMHMIADDSDDNVRSLRASLG